MNWLRPAMPPGNTGAWSKSEISMSVTEGRYMVESTISPRSMASVRALASAAALTSAALAAFSAAAWRLSAAAACPVGL